MKTKKTSNTEKVSYSGEVNIKLTTKSGTVMKSLTVKNIGTRRLFTGISLGLSRGYNDTFSTYLPRYISVGYKQSAEITIDSTQLPGESVLVRSPITYKDPVSQDRGVKTTFSAVISNLNLTSNVINTLGLFGDENNDTLLAGLVLANPVVIEFGMNLIIE